MTQLEENIMRVLTRMQNTGDYILGVENRYYWANEDKAGVLMEPADSHEIFAVQTLANNGDTRIIHEYKHNTL